MCFVFLELRRRYPNRNATTQPSHSEPVLSNDDNNNVVTSSLQHTARSPISLERIHLERDCNKETHRTPVLLERAVIGDRPNGHDDKRTTSEFIRAKQERWRRVDEQPSNLHRAAQ